jgi:ATP-dependent Clp protease protease subunit
LYQNHKPKELYFLISSPGGSTKDGITLYNFLKAIPCDITMHNMGAIDSIAIIIFMAGDNRFACSGTSFHFHGVGIEPKGHHYLSRLKEMVSSIEDDEAKIAHIISNNSKLSEDEIRGYFNQGESKNSDFALDNDIISEVKQAAIDDQFPIHNLAINIS